MMRIDVISIFPDYLQPLRLSLLGKAIADGIIDLQAHDLRDWTHDRHRTVDDTPYGGGAGMVMKPEPWGEALDWLLADLAQGTQISMSSQLGAQSIRSDEDPSRDVSHPSRTDRDPADLQLAGQSPSIEATTEPADVNFSPYAASHFNPQPARKPILIFTTPSGVVFNQRIADELANEPQLAFACGRYEGIDRRVMDWADGPFDVREYSLGDFVLNGGEVAAMAMIEAIVRLVPGVIGNPESLFEESHSTGSAGLLEYPVYTKPASWRGLEVPAVLLSGHHGRVAQWRKEQSVQLTEQRRPDLLA